MADLDSIKLSVEATSEDAQSAMQSIISNLKALQSALSGINTKGVDALAKSMSSLKKSGGKSDAVADSKKQIEQQSAALKNLGKAANTFKTIGSVAVKGAGSVLKNIGNTVKTLGEKFKLSALFSNKFTRSLIRIAGYRVVRAVISSITQGARVGLENLAHASSEANATLSQLSSGALTLQNSMGGALYSVLASVVGVLNTIISAAVSAMNWISMLFSILGGRGTFKKATSATKEYASALGGAAGGASALKQELMSFDEINSLSPDSGGGGGGGGAGMLDYDSMFEEAPVDESLKQMVENADFTLLGETLANKVNTALSEIDWSKIKTGAWKFARSLVTFLNGFIGEIDANLIGDSIAGLVNAGITFANTLMYDMDWGALGEKIKGALLRAVLGIRASDVGRMLAGKLVAAVRLLKGLLPDSFEEWELVTDWMTRAINSAIDEIKKEDVGTLIAEVITGGVSLITSLASEGAFSNLASLIAEAIKTAIESVPKEEVKEALITLLKEAWEVLKIAMSLIVDIQDTTIGKGITAVALFSALKSGMSLFGIKGFKAGAKGIAIVGSIMFALEAIAGIDKIVSAVQSGSRVSFDDIAAVVSNAVIAAGLAVMTVSLGGGFIALGIGVVLKLIPWAEIEKGVAGAAQVGTALVGGISIEALKGVEAAAEGLALTEEQYTRVQELADEVRADGVVSAGEISALFLGLSKEPEVLAAVFKELGITSESATQMFEELTGSVDGVDFSTVREEATATSEELQGVSDAVEEMPIAIGVPKVDDSAITSVEDYGTALRGTGDDIEALAEKIVVVPSEIIFNLQLNNYDTVMKQLDTLAEEITFAGSSGDLGFKHAFSGLGSWFETNVISPVKNGFSGINWYYIGYSAVSSFRRGMKAIVLPKMKVEWSVSSKTATILGKEFTVSIPEPSIKMYKSGGFPDAGELFMANENGVQELVGRVGNRPAVANQDQIGDAIFRYMDAHNEQNGASDYDAMASALVRAMKSAGLGATYIDGKMIKQSLNREAQRSGKPVLGY